MAFIKCKSLPIPDGKTVTPINQLQTLCECAGVFGLDLSGINAYSNIISDPVLSQTIFSNHNAIDYLARCSSMYWEAASQDAYYALATNVRPIMGADNYIFDTLWAASSKWRYEIYRYDKDTNYMLNVKVPIMTSNTTPSGTLSASSVRSTTYAAWKAFDGDESTLYLANQQIAKNATASAWLKYDWGTTKRILACYYTDDDNTEIQWMKVAYSDDNSTYTDITSQEAVYNQQWQTTSAHRYWRMQTRQKNISSSSTLWCPRIHTCQFLGRENV